MRDKRFIAVHRGGPLTLAQHQQLINWAIHCAEQASKLLDGPTSHLLATILKTGKDWEAGKASVGDARNASLKAIALAKTFTDPVAVATTRAVGHAVAAAHMADHALRAADYAIKAFQLAGQPINEIKQVQNEQLSSSIRELVISARA